MERKTDFIGSRAEGESAEEAERDAMRSQDEDIEEFFAGENTYSCEGF